VIWVAGPTPDRTARGGLEFHRANVHIRHVDYPGRPKQRDPGKPGHEEQCSFHDLRQLEYNGVLDLLKAAVARSGIEIRRNGAFSTHRQISLRVRSSAPPASGLGSSAALGVAAIGALVRYCGGHLLPHEIARESQLLEVENLKLECGVQDNWPAPTAESTSWKWSIPRPDLSDSPRPLGCLRASKTRLVLIITGKSHFSSGMHQKVIPRRSHRADFDTLAEAAVAGKEALSGAPITPLPAPAMNTNWAAQKRLHPDITTPEIEALA